MENTNKSMQKLKNEKLIELSTEDIKRIQACILDMMKELDEIKEEKCITIAFVGDERICDGHYYATSFKQLNKYLKRPELLEKPPKNIENNNISEKIEIN